jgi:hypothetical protein
MTNKVHGNMVRADSRLVKFGEACQLLEVSESKLKRMLKAGAPQAQKGRAGRGGGALFDVEALRAWQRQGQMEDALRVFAAELPDLVASACEEAFKLVEGPHKKASADLLAGTWYVITFDLLQHIGKVVPVGGIRTEPEPIKRLRQIARGDHKSPRRKLFLYSAFPKWPETAQGKFEPLRGYWTVTNKGMKFTDPEEN